MSKVTIFAGPERRRRWSTQERARILAEGQFVSVQLDEFHISASHCTEILHNIHGSIAFPYPDRFHIGSYGKNYYIFSVVYYFCPHQIMPCCDVSACQSAFIRGIGLDYVTDLSRKRD